VFVSASAGQTTDRDDRWGEILVEVLDALDGGERPDVAAWQHRYPDFADDLSRFLSGEARVDQYAAPLRILAEPPGVATLSGTVGDFRLVRQVGRGGMGVVYEAEQISLGRRVALKVLPYAGALDAKQLQRFKNEAKAAASLKHEHIVQVYAIGCERGVHFYAMEFIEGQTLAELITRQAGMRARSEDKPDSVTGHKLEALTQPRSPDTAALAILSTVRTGPKDREYYRRTAELIADAADALEHAHSLGIVHRDVKPGNLLVDADGKVYVSDFGLARFGPDAGLTMSGDLLGTLRYMAPEQALARHGLADHRVDVYGLGATLYELLTGKPAVDGKDRADILRHLAFAEPVSLRKIDKAIPAELETIALKCLAKNPNERYTTAGELAADLRRYVKDKPIKAKPPGWRERAARWSRRHRPVVASTFVVMVLAIAGLSVSAFLIWNKEKQVRTAYDAEVRERDRARDSLNIASNVIEQILTRLGAVKLVQMPQMELVRAEVLQDALKFSQQLLKAQKSDVPALRQKVAELHGKLAVSLSSLGREQDAEAAQRQSIRIYVELIEEVPDSAPYRNGLARGFNDLGVFLWGAHQYAKAEDAFSQAIRLEEALVSDWPKEADYRQFLANMYHNLAALVCGRGDPARAEPAIRRAFALRQGLIDDSPGNEDYRNNFCKTVSVLGGVMVALGRHADAEQAFQRAIAGHETLVAEHPQNSEYRKQLSSSLDSLGHLLKDLGRLPAAEAAFKQALSNWQWLAKDFPHTPAYRGEVGGDCDSLGEILINMGRIEEGAESHRQGAEIYGALAVEFPQDPFYRHSSAGCLCNAGRALYKLTKYDEAEKVARQGIVVEAKLVQEHPERSEYRSHLSKMHYLMGNLHKRAGRYKEAADSWRQAIALTEVLEREQPQVQDYTTSLASLQGNLANLLTTGPDPSLHDPAKAVSLAQGAVTRVPGESSYRYVLGIAHYQTGNWKDAVVSLTAPDMDMQHNDFSRYCLGVAHFRTGNWKEAIASLEAGIKLGNNEANSFDCFYLAMCHWQLGHKQQAKEIHARAVELMEKNKSVYENIPQGAELRRLRVEANELLGTKGKGGAEPPEKPGTKP
jgi:serine/threonine protein kinase/tetratricopeptide (TPR) repeat protein